ncbi:NAD-dependent epimerase/dehydratase family protein [Hydrogenophaga sp.]|uniref:NAD-dependent epimerase/dehydratase family protein n=1 Tax=Hydrogenophaga sp. TaxID=1904254 RepID=UPI00286E495A|nr:NAD-dependent epimerase/dehydratase family protein [Hydrogenophaga sp.]
MNIFLTGATGYIGQALVRQLRGRGWSVTTLVREPSGAAAQWLTGMGCRLVRGDVTRPDGLAQAMAGADVLIHNAGVYELGSDRALRVRMQAANVQGTDHVLAAAHSAGVPRSVYVSTVWALGPSGTGQADESHPHDGRYRTPYERSKVEAHQVALRWRERGLPLAIAMPNAVIGANDHSVWGYFLRLYLLGWLPPMAWARRSVYGLVDVEALASGIALMAERAPMGEDYLFCGPPQSVGAVFDHWGRHPGGWKRRLWMPAWFMRLQFMSMEPLQRMLGLPAFMSRETVDASSVHLNYSAAKAQRELGWQHPGAAAMWDRVITEERALMQDRHGFLAKLRHQAVASLEASQPGPSTPPAARVGPRAEQALGRRR